MLKGFSNREITERYPKMKTANDLAQHCALYAHSYVETMILRLLEEQPDFFEDKPVSRLEFSAHV